MRLLSRQHGLSLIELMVAITIGLILSAGVMQIFMSNKRSYLLQSELSRLQENGRFAIQIMGKDVRLSDFWGCHGDLSNVSSDLDDTGTGYMNFTTGGVSGTDDGTNPDTLTLQGGYASGITIETPYMPTPSSSLHVSAGADFAAGDILMVSDCTAADILQATNVNTSGATSQINHNTGVPGITPGNKTGDLSKTYQGEAQVYKVQRITYSIQTGTSGEPSLFRNINGSSQELIEGVEDMQILYGEDTDGDDSANRYLSANDAGLDMTRVVSLRITLTLRTENTNLSNDGDGRMRKTFTSTIAIRNRMS